MSVMPQRMEAPGAAAGPLDLSAKKALAASTIGYAMDGYDFLILGFILAAIGAELGLSLPQRGWLATWTLAGAVVGGIGFGILSDYYGRVRVLTWTILLFAIFTGLSALAQGYWDLVIYRFIAGLGLGGEFGIGMALVAEAWPPNQRARACSYVGLGWQAGVLLAALTTPLLLPHVGWRGMFLIGLIPGLVAFAVRWYVGEPKIFLERAKKPRATVPLQLLVKDTETTKISFAMLVLCGVQNFGYYGLMIWLPSYLSSRFGYNPLQSALWISVTILGMGFGIFVFGFFADLVGRRARVPHVPGGRRDHGDRVLATDRSARAADRRRGHGHLRQWHAGRLRHAAGGALSDGGAGDRGKRAVQSGARDRRLRAARGRRARGELFLRGCDRDARSDLRHRYRRDLFPDPGKEGHSPGVSLPLVMPALGAGIHVFLSVLGPSKTWMARTSPALTVVDGFCRKNNGLPALSLP